MVSRKKYLEKPRATSANSAAIDSDELVVVKGAVIREGKSFASVVDREAAITAKSRARAGKLPAPEKGLGERLRSAREQSGLSQLGLSELTKKLDPEGQGISRTVLTGYEKGTFLPGTRELRVLFDSLQLTPNFLILGIQAPVRNDKYTQQIMSGKELLARARHKLKIIDPNQLEALVTILNAVAPELDDMVERALALDQDLLRSEVIKEERNSATGK